MSDAIKYTVLGGTFHGNRGRGEHRSLKAARAEVQRHNRECECGGVAVVARGSAQALKAAGAYEIHGGGMILPLPDGDMLMAQAVE